MALELSLRSLAEDIFSGGVGVCRELVSMYIVRVQFGCELWRCSVLCVYKYCVCRRAGPLAWCIGRVVVGVEGSL